MSIRYPYTDFHEMNLDWFLRTFQELNAAWEEIKLEFDDIKDAWATMRLYIQNYFNNLDVQSEINNKINAMVASGEFIDITSPTIETETADWLADNIMPTTPPIDTSLSVSNAAADSKTVGDKALITRGQLTTSDDIDNIIEIGTWHVIYGNIPTNWPFTSSGRLIIFGSTSTTRYCKAQIAIDTTHSKIMMRTGLYGDGTPDAFGISGVWTDWDNIEREALQPYSMAITDTYWNSMSWSTVDDLPDNRIFQTDNSLVDPSYGLAITGKYSTLMTIKATTPMSPWLARFIIQAAGSEVFLKYGSSPWINLNDINLAKFLAHPEGIEYTPEWEQGSFSTGSWTKGSSTSPDYPRFIRYKNWPTAEGMYAAKVEISNYPYTVFFGTRGVSAATSTYLLPGDSFTFIVDPNYRTVANMTVCRGRYAEGNTITPVEGANISVTFIPITHVNDTITDELNGIIIPNNTTPVKIGLYGASIVAGYGVSDYSAHLNGPFVQLSLVGGTDFYKYSGSKTWANKFKAYMEGTYPNVTVEQWAVSGATAETYYSYLKQSKELGNTPLNTDVDIAIIMFGNNGRGSSMATNINNLVKIIDLFLAGGTKVYVVTPTPAFNGSYTLNTYQIMMCVKRACEITGCMSLDFFSWIGNACNFGWVEQSTGNIVKVNLDYVSGEKNFLNSDRLHPGDLGHEMIFAGILNLLKV